MKTIAIVSLVVGTMTSVLGAGLMIKYHLPLDMIWMYLPVPIACFSVSGITCYLANKESKSSP